MSLNHFFWIQAKHIPPSSPRPGVALLLVAVAGRRRSRVARNPESLPAAYSPRASASSSISGAPPSCRSADPPRCALPQKKSSPPPPPPPRDPATPPPPHPTGSSLTGRRHLASLPAAAADERHCQSPRSKRSRGPCLALSTQDLYRSHSHRALMTWSSCCGSRRIVASTTHALACPRICG